MRLSDPRYIEALYVAAAMPGKVHPLTYIHLDALNCSRLHGSQYYVSGPSWGTSSSTHQSTPAGFPEFPYYHSR